jgi:general secretion pathway protein D
MTPWKKNNPATPVAGAVGRRSPCRIPARAQVLAMFAACLLTCGAASAQQQAQQQQTITPAFRDADITQIIEAVSTITGKTFIVDPRVRAQVTILSSTPMSPDAFYQAFLSILQVHGFMAVESGNVTKILPDANMRQVPANDLPNNVSATSDEIVTQVIEIENVNAAQLVPSLRPLIPQQGQLAYVPGTNTLVISDRAANVNRMMRIIERLDRAGDDDIDLVRLENASAAEIVRVVNTLFTAGGPAGQGADPGNAVKVVADDRTNSVLISGEQSQRLRMKALITHLDTPLESGGDTQVRYLEYADAEELATKLKEQVQGIAQAAAPGGGAPPQGGGAAAAADRGVTIWADPQNNALIITAPPKIMRSINSIVDKLDIRRLQVQVEAILVEVNANKASEFGVNWAIDGTNSDSTVPIGTFNQPIGGTSILDIVQGINDPENIPTGALRGVTLGAGRFGDTGTNFAVLIRALQDDGSSNIISTPSIVTLDNEEAEIKVAQEVPFITGQYASTGATQGGNNINPFTTVQRQEVGNILKITPQINRGDTVMLKIEQESSFLAQGVTGAVDLITNKRTISTKVMVEDGGIIVLGGLIDDEARESENRFPVLGSIPIIGELFKTRSGSKTKRNLMVFIRPTILRDGVQAAIETNAKYNAIRDQQLQRRNGRVLLLPGERQPTLPPIEELSRYADPTAGAEEPAPGTDRTQIDPVDTEEPVDTTPIEPPPTTTEPTQPKPRDVPPPDSPQELRPRAQ